MVLEKDGLMGGRNTVAGRLDGDMTGPLIQMPRLEAGMASHPWEKTLVMALQDPVGNVAK